MLPTGETQEMDAKVHILVMGRSISLIFIEYCLDQGSQHLSESALWKVARFREAREKRRLTGLDNTTADVFAAFEKLPWISMVLTQNGFRISRQLQQRVCFI